MKEIQKIISLILSNKTNEEILEEIGVLLKVIGRIYVIKPLIDGIENAGLLIDENKIRSISIDLKEPISFVTLKKELSSNYSCYYNHYDEETVVNIRYNKMLTIRTRKGGYIEETDLLNQSFSRFEIDIE